MLSEVVTCNCVRNPGGHAESSPRPSDEGAVVQHPESAFMAHHLTYGHCSVAALQLIANARVIHGDDLSDRDVTRQRHDREGCHAASNIQCN